MDGMIPRSAGLSPGRGAVGGLVSLSVDRDPRERRVERMDAQGQPLAKRRRHRCTPPPGAARGSIQVLALECGHLGPRMPPRPVDEARSRGGVLGAAMPIPFSQPLRSPLGDHGARS